MELIHHPEDLRPGDAMIGPIGGFTGWVIVGPGHLMLGEVFRVGRFSARHVAIVTEGAYRDSARGGLVQPQLVEAMPTGAREVVFDPAKHWTSRHAYVRIPEDYPGQAADAAQVARLMVEEGVAYSFASYPALAAWKWGLKAERLERWIDRRRPAQFVTWPSGKGSLYTNEGPDRFDEIRLPWEAICSVLVDQAWSLAGKRVMEGVARQAVTPGALAGQLWSREGVTWALPREDVRLPAKSWVV